MWQGRGGAWGGKAWSVGKEVGWGGQGLDHRPTHDQLPYIKQRTAVKGMQQLVAVLQALRQALPA
jgi:hypothetical protein